MPAVGQGEVRVSPVLAVKGLGRSFGLREVITSCSLELGEGARLALVGPNGSGKTTLIRCVAGTLTPTRGSIEVGGARAGSMAARTLVGSSLAQERSFYLRLSGFESLLFFARLRHRGKRTASRQVCDLTSELEIDDIARQRVDRCSAGMVQQLSLARALLGAPSLLLLDEPTRSLDDEARQRLWAAIDRRPRMAVVLATHLTADVDRCDASMAFPS